ncbi:MAG: methylmalonyl Co-A mutase-associated GTPase MeaB, partial [Chloroflexota bacterium]
MIDMLAEAVLAGETRAVARAITMVERGGEEAAQLIDELRPSARGGHLIGLTGSPGAGKSSLIGQLAKEFRARGKQVGVIAVDPSSPFSGGAVLGDRVRMQELVCDPGVFVRSMASRGHP